MYSTERAARLSLAVVSGLVVLKVAVGVVTGSISVLAQAADSALDVFAVAITVFAVGAATKPADEEHPFGHGKVENVAAIIQAALLFTAGVLIIRSAVERIMVGTKVELAEAGIGVMLVSIIASVFLSRYLLRVSKATDSIALEANAHNIAADVYSTGAVLVGLTVVRFTGLYIVDPVLAILVSGLILRSGYTVLRRSFGGLVDVRLSKEEEDIIKASITEHYGQLINFHELRTRKAGSQRHIDLHLVMPKAASVEEAHRLCDHLEADIKAKLPRTSILIHVEPCTEECEQCPSSPPCPGKKEP